MFGVSSSLFSLILFCVNFSFAWGEAGMKVCALLVPRCVQGQGRQFPAAWKTILLFPFQTGLV